MQVIHFLNVKMLNTYKEENKPSSIVPPPGMNYCYHLYICSFKSIFKFPSFSSPQTSMDTLLKLFQWRKDSFRSVVVPAAAAAKLLQPCSIMWPYGLQPASLLCLWDSPGLNTGVGCHALQGIFPTQGLNPGLISFALAGRFFTTSTSLEALLICILADLNDFLPNCYFLLQTLSCLFFM